MRPAMDTVHTDIDVDDVRSVTVSTVEFVCVCSQVESHSVRPPSLRLRPPSALLSVYAAVQQHAYMFATGTSRSIMEVKERRPYCSLTKGRKDKEGPYTGERPRTPQSFTHSLIRSPTCTD